LGLGNLSPPQSPPLGGKSELLPPARAFMGRFFGSGEPLPPSVPPRWGESPNSLPSGGRRGGGDLLLPIVSARWRRVTLIVTTGDRFMNALEINDPFEQESPGGQLCVRLKELGIPAEREWWIDEEGTTYIVDLALPIEDGWLRVTFGDQWTAFRSKG
jgi:hypothetical protein